MTETPAEQRLRALITERQRWLGLFSDSPEAGNYAETTAAIDLGREALALLRGREAATSTARTWEAWHTKVAALLARARSVA